MVKEVHTWPKGCWVESQTKPVWLKCLRLMCIPLMCIFSLMYLSSWCSQTLFQSLDLWLPTHRDLWPLSLSSCYPWAGHCTPPHLLLERNHLDPLSAQNQSPRCTIAPSSVLWTAKRLVFIYSLFFFIPAFFTKKGEELSQSYHRWDSDSCKQLSVLP